MSGKTPKQVITSARKTNAGRRGGWLQLATYPQSPFSGPARCCDVRDLYQAFSQRTGPGRLWISLVAICSNQLGGFFVWSGEGRRLTLRVPLGSAAARDCSPPNQ